MGREGCSSYKANRNLIVYYIIDCGVACNNIKTQRLGVISKYSTILEAIKIIRIMLK